MPIFQITTVNTFRNRYVVEASSMDEACDAILIDRPEELSQVHIDESVIDGKQISKSEFKRLLVQAQDETNNQQGLDNAHMGEKIIHRVKFSKA